jgi:hypothetical protein
VGEEHFKHKLTWPQFWSRSNIFLANKFSWELFIAVYIFCWENQGDLGGENAVPTFKGGKHFS